MNNIKHVVDQVDYSFIIKFAGLSFASVIIYVLTANALAYLWMKGQTGQAIRELMRRYLCKIVFVLTGCWFAAGLGGYICIYLADVMFHEKADAAALNAGPKIVLVLFTLFGGCLGVLIGIGSFMKACKVLKANSIDQS